MEVLSLRVGDAIPDPRDRLGPAVGWVADQWDGEVLLVLPTEPEETEAQLRQCAWEVHKRRRNKRRRERKRLDRRPAGGET